MGQPDLNCGDCLPAIIHLNYERTMAILRHHYYSVPLICHCERYVQTSKESIQEIRADPSDPIARSQRIGSLNYLSLIEDPDIQTPSHRVHAFSHFDLQFSLHQSRQRIKLSLEPNHEIIPEGASVQYINSAGEITHTEPVVRHDHKVFRGEAWIQEPDRSWTHCGWARIVVQRDGVNPLFEGAFTVFHDHHHIKLRSSYLATKHALDPELESSDDEYMVMFRGSDIASSHSELKRLVDVDLSCQSSQLSFNSDPSHPVFAQELKRNVGSWGSAPVTSLFGKRALDNTPNGGNSGGVNLKQSIGSTAGCPTSRKVALIGVATDCTYTATFNSTTSAHTNVINQINTASNVYEKTFNISLGLQNLTVVDKECPGTAPSATPWNIGCGSTNITDRLNIFSKWRGAQKDSNAYWTLLTNCPTGAEVGLAWLGQACVNEVFQANGETVSGANVVARTPTEWQVIAHETGHTFGAVHDCDTSQCVDANTINSQQCCPLSSSTCDAGAKYIMNPSTGDGITAFSPCTVGNICSAMGRNSVKTSCLSDNKGVTVISPQQCGNGIVEANEDCDCGGTEGCKNNQCCDATTCTFKSNAVCDDSNDDCCKSCRFASVGSVCRASTGPCDPEETCSGVNATCPPDIATPDGQSCGNSTAKTSCASGQCTSRDQQCKTLMGSFTTNNDTYACNSQDCSLSCASPEFGPNVCYGMQQNFLDGTTCGGGGKCSNVSKWLEFQVFADMELFFSGPMQRFKSCKGNQVMV